MTQVFDLETIRNHGLDEYTSTLPDEEIINSIIKYRTISNAVKSVCMKEMKTRLKIKTPPLHENTEEFITELMEQYPEYFL